MAVLITLKALGHDAPIIEEFAVIELMVVEAAL
jgi:hypothetical protein